jgi:hypothetical protein
VPLSLELDALRISPGACCHRIGTYAFHVEKDAIA